MESVKILKSGGEIFYDDNKNYWKADISWNIPCKKITIFGTTRALTDKERSNIITKLLNKFYFGNYLDYENDIYLCKLYNRDMSKKEEQDVEDMSYSILGEYILELPQSDDANQIVKDMRNLFVNMRIWVKESINRKEKISCTLPFKIYGKKREMKIFLKMFDSIAYEFEYYFFKMTGKEVEIKCIESKMINGKATVIFDIKEV